MKQPPIFLALLVCTLSVCSQEMLPRLSADSSYVTVMVHGRPMSIPQTARWEQGLVFSSFNPFVQNGTLYLYREYSYYQCDTCTDYQLDSSAYYLRPKSWSGYLQHLHRFTYWMYGAEGTEVYYYDAYNDLRTTCPVLHHQQLGDMPRMWYPVVKYRGKYYISIDNLNAIELTDSLVVYHDMEVALSALLNFSRIGEDAYTWQEQSAYFEGVDSVTIRPAKGVEGLYVMTTVRKELGITVHQLITPESDIHHFDFIDWLSSDHIPEGLTYDTIDFDHL
ncbi:MAG: hypothetical protein IJK84_09855 [Bacteroidales bacterium]|nr:hypothetical protein [Bacteroidales bacterium]